MKTPAMLTPIEAIMKEALVLTLKWEHFRLQKLTPTLRQTFPNTLSSLLFLDDPAEPDSFVYPTLGYFILPEYTLGPYRADFMLIVEAAECKSSVIVECDGHMWHTSSKHKVSYDRKRDRWFQANGINVFRFTGHEICRCAEELAAQAWGQCWTNCMEKIANVLSPQLNPRERTEFADDIDRLRQEDAEFISSEKLAIES